MRWQPGQPGQLKAAHTLQFPCSAVAIVLFRSTADFVSKPFGVMTLPGERSKADCLAALLLPCRHLMVL